MVIWKYGKKEFGNMEIRKQGNMHRWQYGYIEICTYGNMKYGNIKYGYMEILKYEIWKF